MKHILVYGDSLSWGLIPDTRRRLPFEDRWPGVVERELTRAGHEVRVVEDCLNGRRTVWEDPFKAGRNGITGIQQRMEVNAPLAAVLLMLGTNDFQSMHPHTPWHSAQGVAAIVRAMREAPIEPGMPVPPILIMAPPLTGRPAKLMTPRFAGAPEKSSGLAIALAEVAAELGCPFFDAGAVVATSPIDGVHLDAEGARQLGRAVAPHVAALVGGQPEMD
jgi:lysophospholipase L1-like esterase